MKGWFLNCLAGLSNAEVTICACGILYHIMKAHYPGVSLPISFVLLLLEANECLACETTWLCIASGVHAKWCRKVVFLLCYVFVDFVHEEMRVSYASISLAIGERRVNAQNCMTSFSLFFSSLLSYSLLFVFV